MDRAPTKRVLRCILLFLATTFLLVDTSWADVTSDVQRLVKEGEAQYRDGNYARASVLFGNAVDLLEPSGKPSEESELYLGTISAKNGDLDAACKHWVRADRFPHHFWPPWPPEDRVDVGTIADPQIHQCAQILADYVQTFPYNDLSMVASEGLVELYRGLREPALADAFDREAQIFKEASEADPQNNDAKAGVAARMEVYAQYDRQYYVDFCNAFISFLGGGSFPPPARPSTLPAIISEIAKGKNMAIGGSSSSLTESMEFIQRRLGGPGPTTFEQVVKDKKLGTSTQHKVSMRISGFEANACTIKFRWTESKDGVVSTPISARFALKAISNIEVMPIVIALNRLNAAEKRAYLVIQSTTPPLQAVFITVEGPNIAVPYGHFAVFPISDQGNADQIAGTLQHAAELCDGE
jgi:tetratricopeptide (TPR) repeat protein